MINIMLSLVLIDFCEMDDTKMGLESYKISRSSFLGMMS